MKFITEFSKIAVIVFLISIISCKGNDDPGDVVIPENTIVNFLATNEDFSTFNAALQATDLIDTLETSGNYTLFVPTNAAFNSFLSINSFESLDDVPIEVLREILLNHLQEGRVSSRSLTTDYITSMATGAISEAKLKMFISSNDDEIRINGISTVVSPDIEVDDGMIHIVDTVIELPDVAAFLTTDPNLDSLEEALSRENEFSYMEILAETESPAPFTIFAPTNNAFAALLEELEMESLDDLPAERLQDILSYHVLNENNLRTEQVTDSLTVQSSQGAELNLYEGDTLTVTDLGERTAHIITPDVQANNGVLHILDTVLLPERDEPVIEE